MSRDEERSLIQKAQKGDMAAFETLVQQHERLVYNLALRTLGNDADAQDAAQEAFIKAWTGLGSFRGDSKFSVWIYRLTNNVCLDMLRKRKNEAISLTMPDDEGEDTTLDIPDESSSPQRILEKKEQMEDLQKAIDTLPEDYRRVLLLREVSDLSYEEIAKVLDMDLGTVKSRIFRARKKLCAILSDSGNFSAQKSSHSRKGGEQA